jgi:hypothetical protein
VKEKRMNASKCQRLWVLSLVWVVATIASRVDAAQPTAAALSAFAGRWQMNAEKTKMGRFGPNGQNIQRKPTFSWKFTPEGSGLRMDVYNEYPLPAPTRSMTMIADGKARQCTGPAPCLTTGGDPKEQTFAYFPINSRMVARLFYTKGEVTEYSTYAVSTDGKTFTAISWSPETPEYQNIQVFEKQSP